MFEIIQNFVACRLLCVELVFVLSLFQAKIQALLVLEPKSQSIFTPSKADSIT
jgi:uncharacterized membrane protein YkvI